MCGPKVGDTESLKDFFSIQALITTLCIIIIIMTVLNFRKYNEAKQLVNIFVNEAYILINKLNYGK